MKQTKAARFRELLKLPEFQETLEKYTYAGVLEILKTDYCLELTHSTLTTYLHRYRINEQPKLEAKNLEDENSEVRNEEDDSNTVNEIEELNKVINEMKNTPKTKSFLRK